MTSPSPPAALEEISELGVTQISLTASEVALLQTMDCCTIVPTRQPGLWTVKDVTRVGTVAIGPRLLHFRPKVRLDSLVYMASTAGDGIDLRDDPAHVRAQRSVPEAFAAALTHAVARATRAGLLKGYRRTEAASSVVRGRWDVSRQLSRRPGVPLPVEVTFDDYTEDILENRILLGALLVALGFKRLDQRLARRIRALCDDFVNVEPVSVGAGLPSVSFDRRNSHYRPALRIADWILRSAAWTTAAGASRGGTFLIEPAALFERFVAESLRVHVTHAGLSLATQDASWSLDAERLVRMRPDIVIRRGPQPVAVIDTKYKRREAAQLSPPNSDVYQALAYALATGIRRAHLIYAEPAEFALELHVPSATSAVTVHGMDMSGGPEALRREVARVAEDLLRDDAALRPRAGG